MAKDIGNNDGEIIIYQSEDGKIKLDVRLEKICHRDRRLAYWWKREDVRGNGCFVV